MGATILLDKKAQVSLVTPVISLLFLLLFIVIGSHLTNEMNKDFFVTIENDCNSLNGFLFEEKGFFVSNIGCETDTNRFFYCNLGDGFYAKSKTGWC